MRVLLKKLNNSKSACIYMASNSSKLTVGLVLGILIGLAGGFLYFNSQVQDLADNLTKIASDLDTRDSDLKLISSEFSELEDSYNTLQKDYNNLLMEKNTLENDNLEIETLYNELLDDYELLVASLPLSPQQVSGTTLEREYEWHFGGKRYELVLSIPEGQYDYYQSLERIHSDDYSVYVTHPYDDEFINTIIRKFNFIALEEHLTEENKISLVISFVQSLPYTVDSVTTPFDEYPRYPLETLIDNGGDCEDTSILTASLLKAMNYDVILISPPEHMAVGVNIESYGSYWEYDGLKYYYLETTNTGWNIGDFPEDLSETAYLYALNPIPLCVHNWTASWNGWDQMDITITATNLGSAMANGFRVSASFDAGEGYVWNPGQSEEFDLNVGNSFTFSLTLDVPKNENTRLIVHVLDSEGYAVDTTYSEWFDT